MSETQPIVRMNKASGKEPGDFRPRVAPVKPDPTAPLLVPGIDERTGRPRMGREQVAEPRPKGLPAPESAESSPDEPVDSRPPRMGGYPNPVIETAPVEPSPPTPTSTSHAAPGSPSDLLDKVAQMAREKPSLLVQANDANAVRANPIPAESGKAPSLPNPNLGKPTPPA